MGTARVGLRGITRSHGYVSSSSNLGSSLVPWSSSSNGAGSRPRWITLEPQGLQGGGGELLVMVELIPLNKESIPDGLNDYKYWGGVLGSVPRIEVMPRVELPQLMPKTIPVSMKVCVLGLRGLKVTKSMHMRSMRAYSTPRRPYIQFDVGSNANRHSARTSGSNTPSSINPSFNEVLDFPLQLPVDPAFMPTVSERTRRESDRHYPPTSPE